MSSINSLSLTVRGTDNMIYINEWNGDWEGWNAITYGTTTNSPATSMVNEVLHIVVRGYDGSTLWHCNINLDTDVQSSWEFVSGSTPSEPTFTD